MKDSVQNIVNLEPRDKDDGTEMESWRRERERRMNKTQNRHSQILSLCVHFFLFFVFGRHDYLAKNTEHD